MCATEQQNEVTHGLRASLLVRIRLLYGTQRAPVCLLVMNQTATVVVICYGFHFISK